MTIDLTVSAFRQMYSGQNQIMVGQDVLSHVISDLPVGISVLVLDPGGRLSLVDDDTLETSGLAPVGMPANVIGILAGGKTEAAAQEWESFAARQGPFEPLTVQLLTGFGPQKRRAAVRFVAEKLSEMAFGLRKQLAKKETATVYLRDQNERLLLGLEKARRMIKGAGFGLQHIAAEMPIGHKTVGPGGTIDTTSFSQVLPCDSSGLCGVGLFAYAGSGPAASEENGLVQVMVRRICTGTVLAQATRPYSKIRGWCLFELDGVIDSMFGDAVLEISWLGGKSGAPHFALSDVDADRFGDDERQTLAMRLFKGLSDPTNNLAEPEQIAAGGGVSFSLGVESFSCGGKWAFGESDPDAEANASLLSFDVDAGWIQTHAQTDAPSGIMLANAIPVGMSGVSVDALTAHEGGPRCLYSLIVLEHLAGEDEETRRAKVVKLIASGDTATEPDTGVYQVNQLVEPMVRSRLRLNPATPLQGKADLYMIVRSVSKSDSFGWCRWSDVTLKLGSATIAATCAPPTLANPQAMLRMRALKFPELAGRISFISGRAKLDELSKKLGFSPLLISEETGSLQTHPMIDHPSAAVMPSGVPGTALRVSCDVETAHDAAPAFIYVMAVVDASVQEKERAIRNLLERIDPADSKSWQGINARKTVQWQAKLLHARQAETIELELSQLSADGGDLVLAVKPAGESVSYGWCRWYSLSIVTAPNAGPLVTAEDENAATGAE